MIRLFFLLLFLCAAAPVMAHPGIGIVMDSEGNVYYTDLEHVWRIAVDGSLSIAVEDVHTHELYIDESDNLYGEHEWYEGEVTDKWGNYVWCLSHSGELEKTVPDVEGFLLDRTLVRDDQDRTYWAQKSDEAEVLMRSINGSSETHSAYLFEDIRWMYYSKYDSSVYVVDKLALKKVSNQGETTIVSKNLKEESRPLFGVADHHYVYGVWTDTDLNVYVAVYGAGKVKRINPDGEVSTVMKSSAGWSPSGGLVAPDGSLWVMEFSKWNTARVKRIALDGTETVFKE